MCNQESKIVSQLERKMIERIYDFGSYIYYVVVIAGFYKLIKKEKVTQGF